MPTYDYICKVCNHAFEIFHSMTELKRKCPECGKIALERQIGTGGAVIFKGSGFYQTDYRSESYKKAAASDSGNGTSTPKEAAAKSSESPKPAKSETTGAAVKPPKTASQKTAKQPD
jgi:putative FmdB family regulatory protein